VTSVDVIETLIRGAIVGVIVAAPIGPVNLICIHRTVVHGRINGFLAGQGAAIGDGIFATVAAFGLAAVAGFLKEYTDIIQMVGGGVLIAMGIRTFLAAPEHAAREDTAFGLIRAFGLAFLLTVTNPATLLGFVAIFAGVGGIIESGGAAENGFDYAAFLVAGVYLGSTLWWAAITGLAGILRNRTDEAWLNIIHHGSGALIVLFGIAVFLKVFGVIEF